MSLIGYARVSTAEGRQWQASTCLPPSSSTGTPPGWAKRSLGEDMPACPWSPSSCHTSRPSVGPTSCSPANTDGKNAELSLTCHFALFRNRPLHGHRFTDFLEVTVDVQVFRIREVRVVGCRSLLLASLPGRDWLRSPRQCSLGRKRTRTLVRDNSTGTRIRGAIRDMSLDSDSYQLSMPRTRKRMLTPCSSIEVWAACKVFLSWISNRVAE